MIARLMAPILLLSLAAPATAQQLEDFKVRNTASLVALCSTPEGNPLFASARHYCYGFIAGAGAMYGKTVEAGAMQPVACPASPPTAEQVRTAFLDWAARTPDAGSQDAIDSLFRAAAATWPCP